MQHFQKFTLCEIVEWIHRQHKWESALPFGRNWENLPSWACAPRPTARGANLRFPNHSAMARVLVYDYGDLSYREKRAKDFIGPALTRTHRLRFHSAVLYHFLPMTPRTSHCVMWCRPIDGINLFIKDISLRLSCAIHILNTAPNVA